MVSRCFLETTKEVMCPMRQASKTSAASSSARWKQPDSAFVFMFQSYDLREGDGDGHLLGGGIFFIFNPTCDPI